MTTSIAAVSSGFLLGLAGSLGHCTGMCGGLSLLLAGKGSRRSQTVRLLWAHLGRLASYTALGAAAGAMSGAAGVVAAAGHAAAHGGHTAAPPVHLIWAGGVTPQGIATAQGLLSLAAAGIALYLALGFLGWVPAVDLLLGHLARQWREAMRAGTRSGPLAAGLVWGLLPCGLVVAGLLMAAAAGSGLGGAAGMFAFGLGTVPAHLVLAALGRRLSAVWAAAWPRRAAALVTGAYGAQLALRGLAALGQVGHLTFGQVALW